MASSLTDVAQFLTSVSQQLDTLAAQSQLRLHGPW
jgi:hypothetical protein